MSSMKNFARHKTTRLSVLLAMTLLLFVLLLGILLGFTYQKIAHDKKIAAFPANVPSIASSFVQDETTITDNDIPQSFLQAKYRVLGVYTSGKDKDIKNLANQVALVVANENNTDYGNDDLCGSMYSPLVCYFFIQPLYVFGAPDADRYLGKLDGQGAFNPGTLKFIDPDKVEFQTADGDAGYSMTKTWELNLTSGKFTLLDTETIEPETFEAKND